MNQTFSKSISDLNELSLISYLDILGFKPVVTRPGSTDYQIQLDCAGPVTLTIDHQTNTFTDRANNRQGSLVDFTCLLFECTPKELLSNVAIYRIDQLMTLHYSLQKTDQV